MTEAVSQFLAVLAVVVQIGLGLIFLAGLVAVVSRRGRAFLAGASRALSGLEMPLALLVAAVATGGSLFYSEYAHFVPCKLCWFQRIAMYPLVPFLLFAVFMRERLAPLFGLTLAVAGGGISVWHILVEQGVIKEAQSCQISAPGGCALKWINEFGYVTIPTLALTAFVLIAVLCLFAYFRPTEVYYVEEDEVADEDHDR